MKKKLWATGIGIVAAGALVLSGAPAAVAAPAVAESVSVASAGTLDERAAALTTFLGQVESIPDEVLLAGDEATAAWIDENLASDGPQKRASILGCAGAIAVALAGVAFPAAKLLKIKKLADELGGVKKAVELLWGASFNYEKVQAAGGALAALGAELLGIASIKEQCFE